MIVTIHQSQYLPWLPYFEKIARSDIFILLDDVQYEKNGVQNRNQIKTPQGPLWLTVPVSVHLGDPINKVKIADPSALEKHLRSIQTNYAHAPYFNKFYPKLEKIYSKKWNYLHDLNFALIRYIMDEMEIKTKIILSSKLSLISEKSDLVLEICQKIGATTYISGPGGKNYLDLEKFNDSNIRVVFQHYEYPVYHQQFMRRIAFTPNLSCLDLILNGGDKNKSILFTGSKYDTSK